MNVIERVLSPLKADAKDRARKEAQKEIAEAVAALAAAGGDINAAAPFPGTDVKDKIEFHRMRQRHSVLHALTVDDPDKGDQRNNGRDPYFVVIDAPSGERYIESRARGAEAEYDEFVRKLVTKIGPVKEAALEGNHVWGTSTLSVTTPTGDIQRWRTQQIVNTSKTGKLFNQWPTKRLST